MLALAPPCEAKIIYTKTHKVIGTRDIYPLDLNHDGVIDFTVQENGSAVSFGSVSLGVKSAFGNAVEGSRRFAAALKKGAPIGPRQRFASNSFFYGKEMAAYFCITMPSFRCSWSGHWANVSNHYLGFRFQIDGETHYGWARLSTQTQRYEIAATLTGYAYETIPHKGIRAGQTSGEAESVISIPDSDASEVSDPDASNAEARSRVRRASLGQLALGAQRVQLRRLP